MLVAITDQNKRFVLNSGIPLTALKQLRMKTKFFCPQCKHPLQLKIGQIKIPHFAHQIKSNCEASFSERESEVHLVGKEHLYHLFSSAHLNVQLEPYLQTIKQRPDLIIHMENKKYAIEFQCSPITQERFLERNAGYAYSSITPIWIPLTPKTIQKNGIMKLSISKQLRNFALYKNHQQYIMSYHPNWRQFIYISNLIFLQGNHFITKVQALPLLSQKFPFYLPRFVSRQEFSDILLLYDTYKHNFLNSRVLISRNGVNDLFLRSAYELRLNIHSLPDYVGIPIKGSESIQKFSVEWQTAFFYFLSLHRIPVQAISNQIIHYFLKWARLNCTKETVAVVRHYTKLIRSLSIDSIYQSVPKSEVKDRLYSHFLAIKS